MPKGKSYQTIPDEVTRSMLSIGTAVKAARIRRRMPMTDLAERIAVSLPTLRALERGDPGVSLSTFVTALWVMDMSDNVVDALSARNDPVGLALEEARLPERARRVDDRRDLDEL